jgi:SAM-dependent methyltransferase
VRPRLERAEGRHLFGTDPETYDAVRPGHADGVYAILRERCGLGPGSTVLEVGPGTGQATRRLLELGASPLVALEPDPQLAAFLRQRLGTRIELVEAALEDAVLEPAAFDLAAAASSFHWVDEETGLGRLRDALRPGGWIALWWTSFGDETRPDPFMEAVDPLFDDVPHSPSAPGDGRPSFARDAERRLAALGDAGFQDGAHDELRWRHEWNAAGIRGLYSTFSPIISLDPEHRERMLASIEQTAATQFEGRVSKPLVTSLYTARTPL